MPGKALVEGPGDGIVVRDHGAFLQLEAAPADDRDDLAEALGEEVAADVGWHLKAARGAAGEVELREIEADEAL